jgi:uncharacterized protein YuzE
MNIKVTYDPEVDAAYIAIRQSPVAKTEPLTENIVVDYADDGEPVGLEILNFATMFGHAPTGVEFALLTDRPLASKAKG